MSAPQQMDPTTERLIRGAADAVAGSVSAMGVQLSLAHEMVTQQQQRIADLEQQAAEKDAELERSRSAGEQMRQRIQDLEAELAALTTD